MTEEEELSLAWRPTLQLRYFWYQAPGASLPGPTLQQRWDRLNSDKFEWRDIPTVDEEGGLRMRDHNVREAEKRTEARDGEEEQFSPSLLRHAADQAVLAKAIARHIDRYGIESLNDILLEIEEIAKHV